MASEASLLWDKMFLLIFCSFLKRVVEGLSHISPGGCACFSSSLRTQESTSEGLNARRK